MSLREIRRNTAGDCHRPKPSQRGRRPRCGRRRVGRRFKQCPAHLIARNGERRKRRRPRRRDTHAGARRRPGTLRPKPRRDAGASGVRPDLATPAWRSSIQRAFRSQFALRAPSLIRSSQAASRQASGPERPTTPARWSVRGPCAAALEFPTPSRIRSQRNGIRSGFLRLCARPANDRQTRCRP